MTKPGRRWSSRGRPRR